MLGKTVLFPTNFKIAQKPLLFMAKKVTCDSCRGTRKCHACRGTGKGVLFGDCSYCDGKKLCQTCDGKGYHYSG
jgi:hypothetical protein